MAVYEPKRMRKDADVCETKKCKGDNAAIGVTEGTLQQEQGQKVQYNAAIGVQEGSKGTIL